MCSSGKNWNTRRVKELHICACVSPGPGPHIQGSVGVSVCLVPSKQLYPPLLHTKFSHKSLMPLDPNSHTELSTRGPEDTS